MAQLVELKFQLQTLGSTTTVKSAAKFLRKINVVKISENAVVVSLDGALLFTPMPKELHENNVK